VRDASTWTYAEAFVRNRGLVASADQGRLREATVAIVGAGGMGGWHALTLARQGVGGFHLIDPDTFSVANFNRQAGARCSSLGCNKALELERQVLDINPEARVKRWEAHLGPLNVGEFLSGVDVVLDALDYFAIDARRLLFAEARARKQWVVSAGPLGFSGILVAFDPQGMSFDDYCDLRPGLSREEQLVRFTAAIAPRPTHLRYLDLAQVNAGTGAAPSSVIGCMLASALACTEVIALLLGWRRPAAAPAFFQFDSRRQLLRRGRLRWGNRGPIQRLVCWYLRRRLRAVGAFKDP
jgi:molybdopterin/thiamine biosynthesis adenylyltransferase